MVSRRLFLRLLAGAGAALGAAVTEVSTTRSEGPTHEDLIDEADGFARGVYQGCRRERGRIVAEGPARFTSRVLTASAPFSHVGMHWEAQGAGDALAFALRVRDASGQWGDWRRVQVERKDGACPAAGVFAALASTGGRARALQYSFESFDGPVSLDRVVASVISTPALPLGRPRVSGGPRFDAGTLSTPARLKPRGFIPQIADDSIVSGGDAAHAWDSRRDQLLDVVSREAWGADESLRFDADGNELWHEMFIPVRALVVHHSGTPNDYASPQEAEAAIRSIYYYHSVIQGWHDIGYNAVIDRFGNIYEGRHGRGGDPGDEGPREVLSEGVSAGQVHLHNYGSTGVALLGDSTADGWPLGGPEGPMYQALVRYCGFEAARAGLRVVDPADNGAPATSDFLRSDNAWHDGIPNLGGHRDSEQTLCPGDVVLGLLTGLRATVDASLSAFNHADVSLVRISPVEREASPGTRISYRWFASQPDPGWEFAGFQYAMEAWFKPQDKDDISYIDGYTTEKQPRLAWTSAAAGQREFSFVAGQPGQYTMHVQALLRGPDGFSPSAFAARDSVLIRPDPATSP